MNISSSKERSSARLLGGIREGVCGSREIYIFYYKYIPFTDFLKLGTLIITILMIKKSLEILGKKLFQVIEKQLNKLHEYTQEKS